MSVDGAVSVVMPVREERENLRFTVEELYRVVPEPKQVLVVYDHDDDSTLPVARTLQQRFEGIELVKNHYGAGPAGALRTGIASTRYDIVVLMAADGSDDPAVIPAMCDLITAGYDVVCGARPKGVEWPPSQSLKNLLSWLASTSLRRWSGMPVEDVTYLYKACRASLLRDLTLESRQGFELGVEIMVKAFVAGHRLTSLPSPQRPRLSGRSHFRILRWLPAYLRWYAFALRPRARAAS